MTEHRTEEVQILWKVLLLSSKDLMGNVADTSHMSENSENGMRLLQDFPSFQFKLLCVIKVTLCTEVMVCYHFFSLLNNIIFKKPPEE